MPIVGETIEYIAEGAPFSPPIEITASLKFEALQDLVTFTQGAFSQINAEEEDE
jgi:hypothetical protein